MLDEGSIHALLIQRERARHGKDWEEADKLRETLRGSGVEVMDRDRTWLQGSTGRRGRIPDVPQQHGRGDVPGRGGGGGGGVMGGFGGSGGGYGGGFGGSLRLSDFDINQTVLQREAARLQKNYTLSDQVLIMRTPWVLSSLVWSTPRDACFFTLHTCPFRFRARSA